MNPLESTCIPTNGEAIGFYCLEEAMFWYQVDTISAEAGIETFGFSKQTLAMFEEPSYSVMNEPKADASSDMQQLRS